MVTLKGEHIFLRALEPEDLDFIYEIENDETIWELSNTQTPYSQYLIKDYLANAHKDIYEVKQLRLLISNYDNQAIGLIDLFDFDPKNNKAGIGILIKSCHDRNKGFGSEALSLLLNYCKIHLGLHQVYCNVSEENTTSLNLFKKYNFNIVGIKKDWNLVNNQYKNEYLLQLLF
ncbi:GNAT family N-acetyltransferase [Mangrovimonas spongiae]|uniref:N-acetyltransferase n=1 Tax=Mangrovimonas spongiae TaxID=2494697 RepID=A0A3R9NV63_9FLAO|nr:GNAT family protein [Mangrovimonas spongiae]RSK38309.1 N-acetyltransferase [Mangrovimonas spongiae]